MAAPMLPAFPSYAFKIDLPRPPMFAVSRSLPVSAAPAPAGIHWYAVRPENPHRTPTGSTVFDASGSGSGAGGRVFRAAPPGASSGLDTSSSVSSSESDLISSRSSSVASSSRSGASGGSLPANAVSLPHHSGPPAPSKAVQDGGARGRAPTAGGPASAVWASLGKRAETQPPPPAAAAPAVPGPGRAGIPAGGGATSAPPSSAGLSKAAAAASGAADRPVPPVVVSGAAPSSSSSSASTASSGPYVLLPSKLVDVVYVCLRSGAKVRDEGWIPAALLERTLAAAGLKEVAALGGASWVLPQLPLVECKEGGGGKGLMVRLRPEAQDGAPAARDRVRILRKPAGAGTGGAAAAFAAAGASAATSPSSLTGPAVDLAAAHAGAAAGGASLSPTASSVGSLPAKSPASAASSAPAAAPAAAAAEGQGSVGGLPSALVAVIYKSLLPPPGAKGDGPQHWVSGASVGFAIVQARVRPLMPAGKPMGAVVKALPGVLSRIEQHSGHTLFALSPEGRALAAGFAARGADAAPAAAGTETVATPAAASAPAAAAVPAPAVTAPAVTVPAVTSPAVTSPASAPTSPKSPHLHQTVASAIYRALSPPPGTPAGAPPQWVDGSVVTNALRPMEKLLPPGHKLRSTVGSLPGVLTMPAVPAPGAISFALSTEGRALAAGYAARGAAAAPASAPASAPAPAPSASVSVPASTPAPVPAPAASVPEPQLPADIVAAVYKALMPPGDVLPAASPSSPAPALRWVLGARLGLALTPGIRARIPGRMTETLASRVPGVVMRGPNAKGEAYLALSHEGIALASGGGGVAGAPTSATSALSLPGPVYAPAPSAASAPASASSPSSASPSASAPRSPPASAFDRAVYRALMRYHATAGQDGWCSGAKLGAVPEVKNAPRTGTFREALTRVRGVAMRTDGSGLSFRLTEAGAGLARSALGTHQSSDSDQEDEGDYEEGDDDDAYLPTRESAPRHYMGPFAYTSRLEAFPRPSEAHVVGELSAYFADDLPNGHDYDAHGGAPLCCQEAPVEWTRCG